MENKLMMPAAYNVMSEEEMTYTEGGAITDLYATFGTAYGVGLLIGSAVSIGNMIWGVSKTSAWVKEEKAKGSSVSQIIGRVADSTVDYMSKSFGNAVVGAFTAANLVGWWPVTAIAWVLA